VTFVDILTVCADFYRKFYTTLLNSKIYTLPPSFIELSRDKIILFEQRQPIISQRSSIMQNWLQVNCPGITETLQI